MALDVIPVRSKRDLRHFIDLPWRIYDRTSYPQWVPPLRLMVRDSLDSRRHPFYLEGDRELFLALRDGVPVARVAAIENRAHNKFHHDQVGFFGFFESQNEPDAIAPLFQAASTWLRDRGMNTIRGPMSPSTNYECGMLVDGFEHHPYLMTTWNPPYYDTLVTGAGFSAAHDLLGFRIPADNPDWALPERYAQHARRAVERKQVTFRNIDLHNVKSEIALCWDIYNAAWESNWGFVPMSREEFDHMGKDLKQLALPQFAVIAEVGGEPAGFMLILPDINEIFKRIPTGRLLPTGIFKLLMGKSSVRTARVMALGIKTQHRTRGIYQLFAHEAVRRGREWGARGGEASWILEDNDAMVRPLEAMGADAYRRWRIYERSIPGAAQ